MADYYDSQSGSYVNADQPQSFGSGLVHDSFPSQGEVQPSHMGSQSSSPDKGTEGSDLIPRADPRPSKYLSRTDSSGKMNRSQADANLRGFDSSIKSFNKSNSYRGPDF